MAKTSEKPPHLGGLHEYRDATEADFAELDLAFYETATVDFTAGGFRLLRDVIDVTAGNSGPRNHCVVRCFLGDGGTTVGSAYQLKVIGWVRILQWLGIAPRRLKAIECDSELNDGTFVLTTNAALSPKSPGFPFVDRLLLDGRTPCAQLIALHRDHVKAVLAGKTGVVLMRCGSYDECRASADRVHLLRVAYRKSPAFDYRAAWEAMMDRPLRRALFSSSNSP